MRPVPGAPMPLYLTGDCAELARLQTVAASLASVGEVEFRSSVVQNLAGLRELGDTPKVDAPVEDLLDTFARLRRSGVVWILWPEDVAADCVVGALAYALAHRWHVGARMHVVTSGPTVGSAAVCRLADFSAVDDATALEHCIRRVRVARTALATDRQRDAKPRNGSARAARHGQDAALLDRIKGSLRENPRGGGFGPLTRPPRR